MLTWDPDLPWHHMTSDLIINHTSPSSTLTCLPCTAPCKCSFEACPPGNAYRSADQASNQNWLLILCGHWTGSKLCQKFDLSWSWPLAFLGNQNAIWCEMRKVDDVPQIKSQIYKKSMIYRKTRGKHRLLHSFTDSTDWSKTELEFQYATRYIVFVAKCIKPI